MSAFNSTLVYQFVDRTKLTANQWRRYVKQLNDMCVLHDLCRTSFHVDYLKTAFEQASMLCIAHRGEDHDKLAGFALLELNAEGRCYMSTLFALQAGRDIVQRVVQQAKQLGYEYLTIESTAHASRFYFKLGFYVYKPGSFRRNPRFQQQVVNALETWSKKVVLVDADEAARNKALTEELQNCPAWDSWFEAIHMVLPLTD